MGVDRRDRSDGIAAAAALRDPIRRQLYEFVAASSDPVGRDAAAEHLGIGRSLAGYHLDQLVADGLLATSYARRSGRGGPGAGRPAKFYERAAVEVVVQLPARDDTTVAHLLASAIETDETGRARAALGVVAREAGTEIGATIVDGDITELMEVLEARGYEPMRTEEGLRLRNCPFHHLVDDHLDLVCSLNQQLLGAVAETGGTGLVAVLDPQPGRCCVLLCPPA